MQARVNPTLCYPLALLLAFGLTSAQAVTLTAPNTTTLRLVVQHSCMLNNSSAASGIALGTLDFGGVLNLGVPITAQTSSGTNGINLRCTPGATATIKINNGIHALAGVRRMKHSATANFVTYQLYKNAGRSQIWDNVTGLSHVFANDTEVHFPIYATVPAQTTPPAGTYSDTLTVTVEF